MDDAKEKKKQVGTLRIPLWLIVVVIVAAFGIGILFSFSFNKGTTTEVVTVSSLEKIVDLSQLSTFEAIYNGVVEVKNEKNPEKIDYYVAYESRVKAGIDFEKIDIDVLTEEKKVVITMPEVQIRDDGITVDMTSLEYMFMNNKANTESVSEAAYKACIADVENEVAGESAIIELAEENARNIVEALVKPFLSQLDETYTLEIQ